MNRVDALTSAVVHGVWDKVVDGYQQQPVLVVTWLNAGNDALYRPVRLRVIVHEGAFGVSPRILALLRLVHSGDPEAVALFEVDLHSGFERTAVMCCDAVIGIVVPTGGAARVAVTIAPEDGEEEKRVFTVRTGDGVVPLWRGYTLVPLVHPSMQGSHTLRIQRLCCPGCEGRAYALCAWFGTLRRNRFEAHAGRLAPPSEKDSPDHLHLPDLLSPQLDARSEERTRARTRAFEQELMQAAWHPARVAVWPDRLDT